MADQPKGKEPTETSEPEKPKASPRLLIIIIGSVTLLIIFIITISATLFLTRRPEPKTLVIKEEVGTLVPMRDFLVNLIDYGGRRYLKVKLDLEVSTAEAVEEVGVKETILRNYIINILSSKTFNDIKTVEGKNGLRKSIILKCNFILKSGKVLNVYFNDFIIQ